MYRAKYFFITLSLFIASCSSKTKEDFDEQTKIDIQIPTISKQNLDALSPLIHQNNIIAPFSHPTKQINYTYYYYYHIGKTTKELLFKEVRDFTTFKKTVKTLIPINSIKNKNFKIHGWTKENISYPAFELTITSEYTNGFRAREENSDISKVNYFNSDELKLYFHTEDEAEKVKSILEQIVDGQY